MQRRVTVTKGQSLVEFALALPLLALLLIGIAQFGFVLYAHVQVANAAREGARAGSLYLGSRFHYTLVSKKDCWSLQQWVENSFVDIKRDADGCPTTTFESATAQAFGYLTADRCADANTGRNCWWLEPLTSDGTAIAITSGTSTSLTPGNPIEVNLVYRYEMPVVANLLPMFQDTVLIKKTVIMRIQPN